MRTFGFALVLLLIGAANARAAESTLASCLEELGGSITSSASTVDTRDALVCAHTASPALSERLDRVANCWLPDVKETDNGRDSLGKIAIEVSKNGTCALESEGLARAAALDAGWSETRVARRASERHRGASVVSAALAVLKHYSALTDEDRQQQARIAARQDKARTEWEASLKASELERKQRTVQLHQVVGVFFVCANANIPVLDDRVSPANVIADGVIGACIHHLQRANLAYPELIASYKRTITALVLKQRNTPTRVPPQRPPLKQRKTPEKLLDI